MHFPLQNHYTSQATLFSFKMHYFEIRNQTWKVQRWLISEVSLVYKTIYYHTKFYQVKNYMFPNWILQEFLSWPFFPVLLGSDHLYHVSKTMKWEQSQHRAHERTSLISFLWTAYCHFPLKNINILKNFLGYASLPICYLAVCIQNPKRIKRKTPPTALSWKTHSFSMSILLMAGHKN